MDLMRINLKLKACLEDWIFKILIKATTVRMILRNENEEDHSLSVPKLKHSWMGLIKDSSLETFLSELILLQKWNTNLTTSTQIQLLQILLDEKVKYLMMESHRLSHLEDQLDFEQILKNLILMKKANDENEAIEEEERSIWISMRLTMKTVQDTIKQREVHQN